MQSLSCCWMAAGEVPGVQRNRKGEDGVGTVEDRRKGERSKVIRRGSLPVVTTGE